jgi:Nucleotidyltransferase domain.
MTYECDGHYDDASLLDVIEGDHLGVLLYGSVARGDAGPESDVDLLQLVRDRTEHYQRGRVSVAVYTDLDIQRMCKSGSLFALHLVREGRILSDPEGELASLLSSYRPPANYDAMWREIEAASAILDAGETVVSSNPVGLNRLGLYLLRCAATIKHIERFGYPSFAIPELADRLGLSDFVEAYSHRDDASQLDAVRLSLVRRLLGEILERNIINPYGSVEALAVNLDTDHPIAARLALRMIAGERTLGYGDLLLDPTLPPDV